MAASMNAYESWLTDKLLSLNPDTDTDVFVSYITGILDEDSPEAEKKESVLELIGQVVAELRDQQHQERRYKSRKQNIYLTAEDNVECACDEIFAKWNEMRGSSAKTSGRGDSEELTEHLSVIFEKQKIETVKTREKTAEEIARKAAILAQYGRVSSGEDDDDHDDDDDPGGDDPAQADLLSFKNQNSEAVKRNEQEMREKSRLEAEKKREKDKQDREMQKQKQKERKETEKKRTQKGEKRR